MNFDSLNNLFNRSQLHARKHERHPVVAPYRHWSIMLAVASASVVASMVAGAFLFMMVSAEQQVEAPQIEQPERLVDQVRLRAVLEAADQKREHYETLRGPLSQLGAQDVADEDANDEGEVVSEDEVADTDPEQ